MSRETIPDSESAAPAPETLVSAPDTDKARHAPRSRIRRISCLSAFFLFVFIGSVILYLLPWRIICNLGTPFVPVHADFSFRLFPEDLDRYQNLRYEEIFSSFPFYLIHDRRPKKTTSFFRDDYLAGPHQKPYPSPEYLHSGDPPRRTLWVVPEDTVVFTVPENIRSIASNAFAGCTFDRIVVPNTVTHFEDGAFSACYAKEIVLPDNMDRVVDRMFETCSTPVITIPTGVKEIGAGAFRGCWNVRKVILPDGLDRIGKEAFRGCHIREIDIPASVTWISSDAFPYSGCNAYVQEHYGHLIGPAQAENKDTAETGADVNGGGNTGVPGQ